MTQGRDVLVGELRNIGTGIARRLSTVGIIDRDDLEKATPSGVYLQLSAAEPERKPPVCYYLYALDAALNDCDWRDLSDARKQELRHQAGV